MFAATFFSSHVLLAALFIVFNPVLWNVIGRMEYKTKRISARLGPRNGVYLVAFLIFILGIVRDYFFDLAMRKSPVSKALASSKLVLSSGYLMAAAGLCLVASSVYRLGIVGTYLGDYFGILFSEKVTAFPFSHFEHPMYQGATMLFLGSALVRGSPIGLMLASLAGCAYSIAGSIEGPFTEMIYTQAAKKKPLKNIILNGRRPEKAGKRL